MTLEIIAEAGSNHNGCPYKACELIDIAVEANSSSVKFQFIIPAGLYKKKVNLNGLEVRNPAYEQRKKEQLSFDQWKYVWNHAKSRKIPIAASVFCSDSLAMLSELGAPYVKISSSDSCNFALIKRAGKLFKRVIVSTGMTKFSDVLKLIESWNALNYSSVLEIMHCVSNYPCLLEDTSLSLVQKYKQVCDLRIGYSDHTLGHSSALIALALGARFFEKHFTLDRSLPGFDHAHALDSNDLADYINTLNKASISLTSSSFIRSDSNTSIRARRGIYSRRALSKGSTLSVDDFDFVRPSSDYSPFDSDDLIGMTLLDDIPANAPITFTSLLSNGTSNLESAFKYWTDEMKEKNILS